MSHPATNVSEQEMETEPRAIRARRDRGTPAEIRELKKMFAIFMTRLDALFKTEIGRIVTQIDVAIEASQRREADMQGTFEKLRSDLNQLSGGMAEQLVRKCGDEEMLERFRRCGWRV